MKATGFSIVLFIGILLASKAKADDHEGQDPTAVCHCKPVISVALDRNDASTSCNNTEQLRKEMSELKSELKAVKKQLDKAPQDSSTFDLYFTKPTISDYVIHHDLNVTSAFTSCFRMRTTDKTGGDRTILSYGVNNYYNEILINKFTNMQVWIHDHIRATRVSAVDGKWHHICFSWENRAGAWKLYKDGVVAASGLGLRAGYVIKTKGVLVIGQEQDSLGGNFDSTQNYIGELTDLNIWNRVLPPKEILGMSKYCHKGVGNVKKWSDFKVGIRGDVRVISPSECEI